MVALVAGGAIQACTAAGAQPPGPSPTPRVSPPSPTNARQPSATAPAPARQSTSTPVPPVAAPTETPSSGATGPEGCDRPVCVLAGHFVLERPIAPPGRAQVDLTYLYGSTQSGARDPHHGVEFLNSTGTPVLAAASGEVVVAGEDAETRYADWPGFYGQLVILRHDLPELEQPLFTLYAHLSEVLVAAGDRVGAGQEIGRVGMSGWATGSHLHFEVRLGENDYDGTRNPELWLRPREVDGETRGVLAGKITGPDGGPLPVENVVVERLPEAGANVLWSVYLEPYAYERVHGDDLWGETFAVGDLPPGRYRVSFVAYGLQVREVEIEPGRLTFVRFQVEPGEGS